MSAKICQVCNEAESKYKCSSCELRYCSIKCYKVHSQIHEQEERPNGSREPLAMKLEAQDEPPSSINETSASLQDQLSALQSHPQFEPLFTKYPTLKTNLDRVYRASQNPFQPSIMADGTAYQARPNREDRVQGQWTQDKADDICAKLLVDLGKREEGVREFMALVGLVLGRDAGGDS